MSGVLFVLMRHAPTPWNEAGRLQGSADIGLSRRGKALAARWRLPAPYDAWPRLASPLRRARQTAALVQPAAAFAVERRLREVCFGAWEGRLIVDLEGRRKRGRLAPGVEPPPQMKRRLRDWAAALARGGQPAVAVAHKGVIRAMRRLARAQGSWRGNWRDDCLHVFSAESDGTVRLVQANVPFLASAP